MSEAAGHAGPAPQSAAAPSPFPPIADCASSRTAVRPLGLYAEEFDADTGRHLGNFPQAFSHLALLEAAARIIVPELSSEH
jgi:Glycosyl hydrolases family 15